MTTIPEPPKNTSAKLSFDIGNIRESIRNISFVQWDVAESEQPAAKELIADILEEGNERLVAETIIQAFRECEQTIYSYLPHEVEEGMEISDEEFPEIYTMELMLPEGFSKESLRAMHEHIKEYAVSRVMADWLSIVNPAYAKVWLAKQEEAEEKLKSSTIGRTKPPKRVLSVF